MGGIFSPTVGLRFLFFSPPPTETDRRPPLILMSCYQLQQQVPYLKRKKSSNNETPSSCSLPFIVYLRVLYLLRSDFWVCYCSQCIYDYDLCYSTSASSKTPYWDLCYPYSWWQCVPCVSNQNHSRQESCTSNPRLKCEHYRAYYGWLLKISWPTSHPISTAWIAPLTLLKPQILLRPLDIHRRIFYD